MLRWHTFSVLSYPPFPWQALNISFVPNRSMISWQVKDSQIKHIFLSISVHCVSAFGVADEFNTNSIFFFFEGKHVLSAWNPVRFFFWIHNVWKIHQDMPRHGIFPRLNPSWNLVSSFCFQTQEFLNTEEFSTSYSSIIASLQLFLFMFWNDYYWHIKAP